MATNSPLEKSPRGMGPLGRSPFSALCGLILLASSILFSGCIEMGPTMFLNGRKIPGAYPFDSFKQVIDEELGKVAGGGKAAKKGG